MSDNQKWHFDKSINAGHILTAVPILLGIVFFGTNLQQGVSSNAQSIVHQNERHVKDIQATNDRLERFMSRVDQQRLEDMARVEKRLDKIDNNVDKIDANVDRILSTVSRK